ncbi:hypothetical protein [Clostridium sp. D33t1_170424_F3]|uniref:hypothetical protein n=1 Tax=Clostridium sp. D33t1_170424_F3 TaxID=2787099 RepID=UPI0018A89726|nr:hypothetical protein [Clostridium sp. D33t1_170424_F3]
MNTNIMDIRHSGDAKKRHKYNAEHLLSQFTSRHPFLSFWAALVGIPAVALGAVGTLAIIIILPIAWLMGWPL